MRSNTRPCYAAAIKRLLITLLLVSAAACTPPHALSIRINPGHEQGVQYAPQELTRMMTELGYQHLRIMDPVTQQPVAVAEKYGEYRLLFQSLEDNNIRVDVHADMANSRVSFYFYNINHSALNASALRLYEQLQQRVRFEYGDDHVSTSQPGKTTDTIR